MAHAWAAERRGQVGLAGPGVPDHQDVLPLVDVLAAGQLGDQHLVDRGPGGEVEGVERLDGREPCGLQAPFGRALLPVEEFELQELEQVGEVVDVVGGGLGRHLLALGGHRREAERLQVVLQEHQGLGLEGLHGVVPFCRRHDLCREGGASADQPWAVRAR